LAWWESLAISADKTSFEDTFTSYPHAANAARLFSNMGSTQSHHSAKHWQRFEPIFVAIVIKLRNTVANGRAKLSTSPLPMHHQCPVRHVAAGLEANFTWAPPLTPQMWNIDDDLAGPESISIGARYLLRKSVDEIIVVDHTSHDDGQWDVDILMSSNGVSQ
jgi:hypothetical protein